MRARILIVAALMAGVWAAARFKPASENNREIPGEAADAREILRVDAPGSDGPVVSDLEARQAAELALIRPVERKTDPGAAIRKATDADAGARLDPATVAAALLVPEVSRTTSSMTEVPQHLAQAPTATLAEGIGAGGGDQPADGSRGPAVIIRGGSGSPNDPCALHGPRRTRGPGIAINSTLPPFRGGGGGVLVNDRAPRGGTGRGGMHRGGIR